MSTTNIINADQFDTTNITFGKIKELNNGTKSIEVLYDQQPFYLRVPPMPVVFGAKDYKDNGKFSFSTKITQESADVQQLFADVDHYMIKLMTHEMCVQLLGASKTRPFSQEVIASKYKPLLKEPKKAEFAPTIKFNLSNTGGNFYCQLFDESGEEIEVDTKSITKLVKTGSKISTLVNLRLWANATGFGLTLNPVQAKVYANNNSVMHKSCLLD